MSARGVVLAPLQLEALALRSGKSGHQVLKVGMGPERAHRTTASLLTPGAATPTVLAGLAGALDDALRPGDLIVATELLDAEGTISAKLTSAPTMAATLRRAGHRVIEGALVTVDHIVSGPERQKLRELGAIAVDMESTAVASAVGTSPFSVVRVVADTPGRELLTPAGLWDSALALKELRSAGAAIGTWLRACADRKVLLASPRAFCAGVRRAVDTVAHALERFEAPVYVRRQIVHNAHVIAELESSGAVFVSELEEVPDGSTVIFSAHGVAPAVRAEARRRDLHVIDATCPLVAKVHTEVRRFSSAGYEIVLVGHEKHDETEGTLGEAEGIHLVHQPEDIAMLDIRDDQKVAYITQTTLALDETTHVVDSLRERWPELVGPPSDDICYASQNRQDAVKAIAPRSDVVLVVGSQNSSNSRRLTEVAHRHGAAAYLVDDVADVDLKWLDGVRTIGLTAGASAPDSLVQSLTDALGGLGMLSIEEIVTEVEQVSFSLPPEVR